MSKTAILFPMFALAAWTFCMLLNLAYTRFSSQTHPKEFRFGESEAVPARPRLANRNYVNLLELPNLFYVACLIIFVTGIATQTMLVMAWLYVGLRILHSLIHISYNNVFHRFLAFALSNLALIGLWVLAGCKVSTI